MTFLSSDMILFILLFNFFPTVAEDDTQKVKKKNFFGQHAEKKRKYSNIMLVNGVNLSKAYETIMTTTSTFLQSWHVLKEDLKRRLQIYPL